MDLNALMRKKYFKGNKHVIPWFSHMNVPLILIYLMISQKFSGKHLKQTVASVLFTIIANTKPSPNILPLALLQGKLIQSFLTPLSRKQV